MHDVDVDADLRLAVTAWTGESTTAHVTATGRRVRVESDRPDVLFDAVDRADVGRIADLLAAAGVTVSVVGPSGPTATLGAGTTSRFGRIVTGSSRVSPAPRATVRLAWSRSGARVVVAVIPVVVAAVVAVRRSRRR